ncbi:MAG: WecB/TagA/CpsF family glycosyltransferase [Candidatus Magasanikbacteria bacterium]|nr:WecB/TagA/CpsF family glycosyltransferase [Candidatus Magasanikbacteria bacterium]
MKKDVLGVKLDMLTKKEVLLKITSFLDNNKGYKIYTPNPEMLVDAQKDKEFRDILNSSDLNTCDGKGIEFVTKGRIRRIPGVDLMLDICKLAAEREKSVYLLGSGSEDVVEKTKKELIKKFPKLKISGIHPGPKITMKQYNNITIQIDLNKEENQQIINNINLTKPDILFVAFGHPKQEKWINQYLKEMPSLKIAMGVGGSFDFISGKVKRAPKWIRTIGLEWLWRLILQPWRIKRIWKATGKFLFLNYKKLYETNQKNNIK